MANLAQRAEAFCDSTGNLFDDEQVLVSFQLFTEKAAEGFVMIICLTNKLFEDPDSDDIWIILNNQDFLDRFFYFCSKNQESLSFDDYVSGLLSMFSGEGDLKNFRFKVWDVDHTNELSRSNMSTLLHSILTTFIKCKLRSNKVSEEKAEKILAHVEEVAAAKIVDAFIEKLYQKIADNDDKTSISYEAYSRAFDEDDDQFDWNDIAAELTEQLEDEISAL